MPALLSFDSLSPSRRRPVPKKAGKALGSGRDWETSPALAAAARCQIPPCPEGSLGAARKCRSLTVAVSPALEPAAALPAERARLPLA